MADCPFKIGDVVVALADHDDAILTGKCGVVKEIEESIDNVGIEFFDAVVNKYGNAVGHALLHDSAKSGHGWWMPYDKVKLHVPKKPKRLRKPKGVFTFDELVNTDKYVPELTRINISKCLIASATYPYAILDEDGQLWFYKEPPKNTAYFMTAEVKFM